ncbi:MAG: UvrD-helicase domain-containing protein [Polyangiaceae bacterium]|nr:UvrD-helicase domain-containing protein [Polyangiaceae bacterium]
MPAAFVEHPRAISEVPRGASAVIEASAGTGKTYTLTHLVADRILTGASTIDRLLVVTFTEKATRELRGRLRALLESLAAATGGRSGPRTWRLGDAERARVRAAIEGFDAAEVFTIHGFCQRALAELSFSTGRPLVQTVVDGRRAFAGAYRRSLRRGLGGDEALRPALERALGKRSIDDLGDTLAWMHEQRVDDGPWRPAPAVLDALARARDGAPSPAADRRGQKTAAALAALTRALALPAEAQAGALLEAARAFPDDKHLDARTRRVAWLTYLAAPLPEAELALGSGDPSPLLARVEEELARAKARSGELDFRDMLTDLAQVLAGARGDEATRLLRRKYDAAIVDEFQDIDDTQWSIFRRLFGGPGAPPLVVVGDPKQAIYAFRGADVLTYLGARGELVAEGARRLDLKETRRSTGPLTDAINALLSRGAPRPLLDGLTPYDPEVECRATHPPLRRGRVELAPVVIARSKERLNAQAARAATTRFTADEIVALLSGTPATTLDRARLRRADILVLGYTTQDTREVGDALRARGVPHTVAREDPLFSTYAASATRDVLCALAEPAHSGRQRLALASPYFAVPFRELERTRDLGPTHPGMRALASLAALAARGRWPEVFAWLADESGIIARARLLERPETEIATWLAVLDALARECAREAMSADELAELASALVDGRAEPTFGEQRVAPPLEDAVRLLTVHGAKGLEAKIVFLVGGRNRNLAEPEITVHDGATRRALVGERGEIGRKKRRAERDEEDRRLAYVALTRAQHRLYLFHAPGTKALSGPLVPIHDRLDDLLEELDQGGEGARRGLFEIVSLDAPAAAPAWRQLGLGVDRVEVDPALLEPPPEPPPLPRAPRVTSYTAERHRDAAPQRAAGPVDDRVPGGARVGRAVHEVLERVPLDGLACGEPREAFVSRPEHLARSTAARRRHGAHALADLDLLSMVHAAYCTPIRAGGLSLPPLSTMRVAREVELAYPWPEAAHASPPPGAEWPFEIDRGLVRGYVDLIAVHEGRAYVVDWKTDRLAAYDAATLTDHVEASYALQAQIYGVGVRRQLALTGGRVTLGGVLYVFVRGLASGGGVYATITTDRQLDEWEAALRGRTLS